MTAYVTMLVVAMLVLLPIYILLRRRYLRRREKTGHTREKPSRAREALLGLFVLFCAALAALVFDGFSPWHWSPQVVSRVLQDRLATGGDINLVPFRTIRRFLELMDLGNMNISAVNLVGNVLMFVPLGFCLPLLWRRWQRWWKMLLLGVLLPVGIETVQLLLPRGVDIDDVILNAAGIWLGWGLCSLARRLFPRLDKLALPTA